MKRSSVGQISCTVAMATILITCITIVIIAAVVVIAGDILINVALQERRIDRNGVMMMAFTWRSWLSRDSQVPKILMMTFPCRTWLSQDSQVPKNLTDGYQMHVGQSIRMLLIAPSCLCRKRGLEGSSLALPTALLYSQPRVAPDNSCGPLFPPPQLSWAAPWAAPWAAVGRHAGIFLTDWRSVCRHIPDGLALRVQAYS
jgi:hypothetical protein